MNQASTWQRLAVGQALRHDKFDLDQHLIADHCENRYGQWPARKQLLIKMAQVILLGLIQHREDASRAPIYEIIYLKQFIFLIHIQFR